MEFLYGTEHHGVVAQATLDASLVVVVAGEYLSAEHIAYLIAMFLQVSSLLLFKSLLHGLQLRSKGIGILLLLGHIAQFLDDTVTVLYVRFLLLR